MAKSETEEARVESTSGRGRITPVETLILPGVIAA
jgi:hypothetical protein